MLRCCAETTGCLAKRCTPVTHVTLIIIETRPRASCLYKTALMFPCSYPFRCCLLFVKHGFIYKGGCPHCLCLIWSTGVIVKDTERNRAVSITLLLDSVNWLHLWSGRLTLLTLRSLTSMCLLT